MQVRTDLDRGISHLRCAGHAVEQSTLADKQLASGRGVRLLASALSYNFSKLIQSSYQIAIAFHRTPKCINRAIKYGQQVHRRLRNKSAITFAWTRKGGWDSTRSCWLLLNPFSVHSSKVRLMVYIRAIAGVPTTGWISRGVLKPKVSEHVTWISAEMREWPRCFFKFAKTFRADVESNKSSVRLTLEKEGGQQWIVLVAH